MSRLYDTQRWKRARRQFLAEHPLCVMCEQQGRVTLAVLVDHITPHKGDEELFWDEVNNWQGLCATDHSAAKQELEKSGTIRGCDVDGVPLDPNHPWRRGG